MPYRAALLSEQFPTRVRYTASALSYNVAYTIFGGTRRAITTRVYGVEALTALALMKSAHHFREVDESLLMR